MKNTIKSYSFVLLFILLSTFIFSLILTILKQNNLLNYSSSNIVTNILSLSLYFIGSLILGLKQKNKGLINGIMLSIIFVCISLILGISFASIIDIIKFISKILLIMLGTIIGVNLKRD